jgi:molybdopterin/thiamine biosynthesis adenylyltransferase
MRSHAVVVGAGGNIGSQLVPLVARWPGVGALTLIDRDVYEAKNLTGQNISAADVGRSKARCQASSVRRIRPDLAVRFYHADVESLPLGCLRGDIILACLDSRRSRQYVNEAARRLGVPWIDSGVAGEGLLARAKVYGSGDEHACLECAWDGRDYELLEVSYACQGDARGAAPATDAPASLGALAAALQAVECQKLLGGRGELALTDREVLLDALHHRHYVTSFRRNANCRLGDHSCWQIEKLPGGGGRARLTALADRVPGAGTNGWTLSCYGQRLARLVVCPSCGEGHETLVTTRALAARKRQCRRCGVALVAGGLHVSDRIALGELTPRLWNETLAHVGLRAGDVLTLSCSEATVHLEIDDDAR